MQAPGNMSELASVCSEQTRDVNLWFEDGSIVLEADNTFFKVYSGILAQSSPVFRDMFSFPQGGSDAEIYDECPLVHMPDPAHDLRHFLRALNDCSYFNVDEIAVKDFLMVVGVLRLSTKYEVPHLRRRAIEVLTRWYPSDLESFLSLPRSFLPREEFPRHALVALVARETDVPVLLPSALLLCCATASARTLWDGTTVDGERLDLDLANKRALFLGRPLLSHYARTRVQSFFFYRTDERELDKVERCQAPERCGSFCRIYASVYDEKEDPWMNPFYKLNWKSIRSTCCNMCAGRWERHYDEATKELWKELPKLLDLPAWTELKEHLKNA